MLKEIPQVRQVAGEPQRRWFVDDEFDLIVWLDDAQRILGFQLSYNKNTPEQRALTWKPREGYTHDKVDDGEDRPGNHKSTPILVPDGAFDYKHTAQRFQTACDNLELELAQFIYNKIMAYPK